MFFYIEYVRFFDHAWREYSGLPNLNRSMITPNLYLGGQYTIKGYDKLFEMGMTGIVNMRTSPISPRIKQKGIKVLHLPTPDLHAPALSDLQKGNEFIKKEVDNGGKVYVHCRLGEGRGPTMIISYLMSTGLLFEDAHQLVKDVRPFIRLTKPQRERLLELQNTLPTGEALQAAKA